MVSMMFSPWALFVFCVFCLGFVGKCDVRQGLKVSVLDETVQFETKMKLKF